MRAARKLRGRYDQDRSLWLFGPAPLARQVQTHALSAAADAFFAVSLAGSLFFNVSLDAARPRVILYLALTMAPFAVVAPLIGPVIDRVPGGYRLVVATSCAGRGAVCVFLARDLRNLYFYPEAFAVLVLGKAYSVARNALVPRLVDDPDDLVETNSRLSRTSTVAGALGGAVATAVLVVTSAGWVLGAAALIYGAGSLVALQLPTLTRQTAAPPSTRPARERAAARLALAASAMSVLRASVGFLLFLLGFALRRAGEPAWLFGVVFAAAGLGGFAGTFLAPRVRRRVAEQHMLIGALAVPAVVALAASLSADRPAIVAVAISVGLAATVGRQAFDSLAQHLAPHAERGRAFAGFETRFQLAWVLGALVAVVARPPTWAGFVALAVGLTLGAASAVAGARAAGARPPRSLADDTPLSDQLRGAAERSLAERRYRLAVVQAALAVELAPPRPATAGGTAGGTAADAVKAELATLRGHAATAAISTQDARRAVEIARLLLSSSAAADRPPPNARRAQRRSGRRR